MSTRHLTGLGGAVALALVMLHAGECFAESRKLELNIPSAPLGDALTAFGKQSGAEVLFLSGLVAGRHSHAISGRFSTDSGLTAMLAGTGLTFRYTGDGVYLIERVPAPPANAKDIVKPDLSSLPAESPPTVVVVRGYKASLSAAALIRRRSTQLVDAVVATDIGKLPDDNAAEALQRIGGVQIGRDQGEGATVSVRGLTQIRSELDGRSIFTPSSAGRTLNYEDVPSEVLAEIEVHKTPSADQVEGGLSGTINLRLRRPFDFKGFIMSGQARTTYYDSAGREGYGLSGLISNRWNTSAGEMGLLFSGSVQNTAFRSDFDAGGSPMTRTDILDLDHNGHLGDLGDAIVVPSGGGLAAQFGTRDRRGVDLHFQWRPSDLTDFSIDAFHYRYRMELNAQLLFAVGNQYRPATPVDFVVQPDTNLFQSGTWQNLTLDANTFTGGRTSDVSQLALRGQWRGAKWKSSLEAVIGTGRTDSNFYQVGLTSSLANPDTGRSYGAIPLVKQDYGTGLPSLSFSGIDLTLIGSYAFDRAIQSLDTTRGTESSIRFDGSYSPDAGIVTKFKFGTRVANRSADELSIYDYQNLEGAPSAVAPQLLGLADLRLFRTTHSPLRVMFWAPRVTAIQNFDQVLNAFGLADARSNGGPTSNYAIYENSWAIYGLADYQFNLGGAAIVGDAGVRAIYTNSSTRANGPDPSGVSSNLRVGSKAVDILPQMNIKASLRDDLILRGAVYSSLTRQDFSTLSPQVTLDYLFHIGSQGNPTLKPLRGTNVDLAVEYEKNPRNSAYVDLFFKHVTGFIQNEANIEVFGGQTFSVLRPKNGSAGKIWGYEVGFTRFLTNWPAPWNGLGLQASYTEVSSETPSPSTTQKVPLEGLSKTSYNIVLMYEAGRMSARLAYNWRSRYVITSALASSGFTADWSKDQGVLDGSVNVAVTSHVTVSADIANIANAQTRTYYGDPRIKHNVSDTDTRMTFGVRYTY